MVAGIKDQNQPAWEALGEFDRPFFYSADYAPGAAVNQIGEVQARSWMVFGSCGSAQVAGRSAAGSSLHW